MRVFIDETNIASAIDVGYCKNSDDISSPSKSKLNNSPDRTFKSKVSLFGSVDTFTLKALIDNGQTEGCLFINT